MARQKGITKKKMTISIDIEIHEKIKNTNINISKVINTYLKEYLSNI